MARDNSILPRIMAGGPPELVEKKAKDWRKTVWLSNQKRATQLHKATFIPQPMDEVDADILASLIGDILAEFGTNVNERSQFLGCLHKLWDEQQVTPTERSQVFRHMFHPDADISGYHVTDIQVLMAECGITEYTLKPAK